MNRTFSLLIVSPLCALFLVNPAKSQITKSLLFSEKTEDKVESVTYQITKKDKAIHLEQISDTVRVMLHADGEFQTQNCQIVNTKNGESIRILRDEKQIHIQTKESEHSFDFDDKEWYQSQFCLADFIKSDDKKRSFYFLPVQMVSELSKAKPTKIAAKKEKIETICVNGQDVETVKVKINLTGFKKFFWSAQYWYRLSDGCLVYYEVPKGRGAPTTIGTLVEERHVCTSETPLYTLKEPVPLTRETKIPGRKTVMD